MLRKRFFSLGLRFLPQTHYSLQNQGHTGVAHNDHDLWKYFGRQKINIYSKSSVLF